MFIVNAFALGLWPVTDGVLQGSILRPVLFQVVVNDSHTELEGILSLWLTLNWEQILTPSGVEEPCRGITHCMKLNKGTC